VSNALGVVQQALIDRAMVEIDSNRTQQSNLRQSTNSGSSSGVGPSQPRHPTSNGESDSGGIGKDGAKAVSNGSNSGSNGQGEGSSGGSNLNPGSKPLGTSGAGRLLACPYFKRNPESHRKYKSCAGPGWKDIHRLKLVIC
jgi:hypothetical protein